MSEEEKKAIEELEFWLKYNYAAYEGQKNIKTFSMMKEKIKKQQKEIEERDKYNITTLPIEKIKADIEQNKNVSIFGKEYISKDKIRELLEEYKDTGYYELEQVLKELLEEN